MVGYQFARGFRIDGRAVEAVFADEGSSHSKLSLKDVLCFSVKL